MSQHNDIGKWGEEEAKLFLISRGYAIMESNLHVGHKEIDIVATKGTRIIFVEVKTRSSDIYNPTEAIDSKKISRICRAADSFINSHEIIHEPQFDVITVIGTPDNYKIEHIPDAFRPPLSSR